MNSIYKDKNLEKLLIKKVDKNLFIGYYKYT